MGFNIRESRAGRGKESVNKNFWQDFPYISFQHSQKGNYEMDYIRGNCFENEGPHSLLELCVSLGRTDCSSVTRALINGKIKLGKCRGKHGGKVGLTAMANEIIGIETLPIRGL